MYSFSALKYAAAAVRIGSFSAAAKEFGVKQPTVSSAIADLERALGTALFRREGRRLTMTPAGDLLMPQIHAILSNLKTLDDAAKVITKPQNPELRLGFTPLLGAYRLGRLTDPFTSQYPEVRLVFFESSANELNIRLDAGDLDIIFGVGISRHRLRRSAPIFNDALSYLSNKYDGLKTASLTIQQIATWKLLLSEDLCGLASATRNLFGDIPVEIYQGRAMSYNALEDWADLGLGGAVIPEAHLRNKHRALSLVHTNGERIEIRHEAVWRKDLLASRSAKKFTDYLYQAVPALANKLMPNRLP